MMTRDLRARIHAAAMDEGFDLCGIAAPDAIPEAGERLDIFLQKGYHGEMGWLAATAVRRKSPAALWSAARTVVVLGMNYGPDGDPLALLEQPDRGFVSVYARHRDYHDVIKGKLKTLAGRIVSLVGGEVKVFVDTAPVMEKPLAVAAGLGWQGKHSNLVSRSFGSWLFLGVIFMTAAVEPDDPETDHCGSCRACLDICPTNAFPEPYVLDARRCISYLTIEHKGVIDPALREKMGNRIYGCDDCLAVCPWNKFAQRAREARLRARDDLDAPCLAELAALDDRDFRLFFSGSPVKRIGRDRFVRNVLIAIGNSADVGLASAARALLRDRSALVRGMVVWALARLLDRHVFVDLRADHVPAETDEEVLREWMRI